MNKKLLSLLLFVLAAFTTAFAQETVTVYDGTDGNNYVPVYGLYAENCQKCEIIMAADQLGNLPTGSTITGLTWYLKSKASANWGNAKFKIFMKEVDATTLSDFYGMDGATIVYDGDLDPTADEMVVEFDANYTYQGGNLLIGVYEYEKGTYKSASFKGVTVTGASIGGYASSLDGVSANARNFVPKTTFTYIPAGGVVYTRPQNLQVGNITPNSAKLTWEAGSDESAWNVEYKKAADEAWTSAGSVSVKELTLDALTNGTTYDVRVNADYGEGNVSGWVYTSFKTLYCDAEEIGQMSYSLSDSYGDGWNGAAINVVNATTGEVIETLTIISGGKDEPITGTVGLCLGETYNFVWVAGNYPGECSFTLTDPFGEVIFECQKGEAPAAGQFASYTYQLITCPRPTALAVNNVVYNGATLSWTPGDAEQDAWEVVYGATGFNPDEATPVAVSGQPTYTITGLTENTAYQAYVRGNCGENDKSNWSDPVNFTTPLQFPIPTELAVSDITAHTAKASWEGSAESYNVRYRKAAGITQYLFESFEGDVAGWLAIDSDGDGNNWEVIDPTSYYTTSYNPYDGDYVALTYSYNGDALTPDQWLISPKVTLDGTLKYFIMDNGYWTETYRIYVSTTGNNISDFSPITDDLLSPASATWTERTVDLSSYAGQQGYIAFRHYNCEDRNFMFIDAISIEGDPYEAGEWITVNDVTSPYNITGLEPETEYEVQVQGVYGGATSSWTEIVSFTTLPADAMPYDLTVTEITDKTAVANWNGSQDSYNLRYRSIDFFNDFENGLEDWTIYTDGTAPQTNGWYAANPLNGLGFNALSGSYAASSWSWNSSAYNADNWLITPQVTFGKQLTFWVRTNKSFPDSYEVLLSTTGNAEEDFTVTLQAMAPAPTVAAWNEVSIDLSAYEGQTGYIAIHHVSSDCNYLLIDNFGIGGEWVTVNNVTNPADIENLDPKTDYEVQVQGILDDVTTDWTAPTYFTTLEKRSTLAEICQNGVITEGQNEYVIADKLIAVYADATKGILWCKDQGNASVFSTSIKDGQVDFLKDDPQAQNGRDWDQSNWIALHFSTPTATNNIDQLVNGAVNRYIKPGTVKGKLIDDVNYALRMDLDQIELVTQADDPDINPDYIPNVYCPANFMPTNLNIWGNDEDGGYTEGSDQNYFFMNPKIQEICEVTYAQWDATHGCFTVPTSSGFDGAFYIGTGYNVIQSQNFTSSLQDEHIYKFKAIVQRSDKDNYGPKNVTTPATGITLYPVDLDPVSSEIPTAINTVNVNGEVVGVEYVNSLGVVSKRPFSGMNIVVTRYSNGTTTSVKKIFK